MSRTLTDAVITSVGYADPLTGELLKTRTGMADPVAYYKPNARNRAFIAPNTVDAIVMFKRNRATDRKVRFALQTVRSDISSVTWNFGNGTTVSNTARRVSHSYAAAGTYTVTATANYASDSANNRVTTIAVTNGGSGYTTAPTVVIAAPASGGTQAAATAVLTDGVVTSINVTTQGTRYATAPAVSFTGGGGTGATATATIAPTVLTANFTVELTVA